MRFSPARALTIARREYLTTIRRKAFVFTLIFVPAYYALISAVPSFLVSNSIRKRVSETHVIAVVDSSGSLAGAEHEIRTETSPNGNPFAAKKPSNLPQVFTAQVEFFPDEARAQSALREGKVNQLLVIAPDYLATGRMRRYTKENSLFGSNQDASLRRGLTGALIAGQVEPTRADRAGK